ncbi:AAA family ATPase [Luteolibacter soli]|uniref:AAA family ATPase n=1 Tax=Luteolibacter soli TaxID=3135280 RepID=A0ABU9AW27_9BACT
MRILISGGPGSGCTSTAEILGKQLGLPVFDSDSYFHKPTDPPFQEQYTPDERRDLLDSALKSQPDWILSGSVATWGLPSLEPTHGIFLDIPKEVRLDRLLNRQKNQFGSRIDPGGDMQEEHESFIEWAAGYDDRTGSGRNATTDRSFLETHCGHLLAIAKNQAMEDLVLEITSFLTRTSDDPHRHDRR